MNEQHNDICPFCGATDYTIETYKGTHVFTCRACERVFSGTYDPRDELGSYDTRMDDDQECEERTPVGTLVPDHEVPFHEGENRGLGEEDEFGVDHSHDIGGEG